MNLPQFIYTQTRPGCYYRHFLFWSVRYAFLVVSAMIANFLLDDYSQLTPGLLWQNSVYLLVEMGYTWLIVYIAIPGLLLKRKFALFILTCTALSVGTVFLIGWLQGYLQDSPRDVSALGLWGMFWSNLGYGPPAVCALFVMIKTIKSYGRSMDEKQSLVKENEKAESLLLQAQVHPHFLFNTLNNIYSFTRTAPDTALRLIESLSATIRYMRTDCSAEYILLKNELQLIGNYLQLEKVRYGERLHVDVRVAGDPGEKSIDPLLLIPLIENCFKHGASQMLEEPWIRLHIFIGEAALRAEISNNRPMHSPLSPKKGIGLENVRSRLKLLHPGKHLLEICPGSGDFLVRLEVPLQPIPTHSQ